MIPKEKRNPFEKQSFLPQCFTWSNNIFSWFSPSMFLCVYLEIDSTLSLLLPPALQTFRLERCISRKAQYLGTGSTCNDHNYLFKWRGTFYALFKWDGRIFTPNFGLGFCLDVNNILKLFTSTTIWLFSYYNCSLKIKDTHWFSWEQGGLTLKSSPNLYASRIGANLLSSVWCPVYKVCVHLYWWDTWLTFLVYLAKNRLNPLSFWTESNQQERDYIFWKL